MVERGVLPKDFYIAMDCVGAIPYYGDVRTLDRLGLTDARIARAPSLRKFMAHTKVAPYAYAQERGVDLWIEDRVHSLMPLTAMRLLQQIGNAAQGAGRDDSTQRVYAADAGDGLVMLGRLPQGISRTRARAPRLNFRELTDSDFLTDFAGKAIPAYETLVRRQPENVGAVFRLAYLYLMIRQYPRALELYGWLDQVTPNKADVLENLGLSQAGMGDTAKARGNLTRALALARSRGDRAGETRLRGHLQALGPARMTP
jgi:tetratricopeptide (TPR) repeat protein